MDRRAVQKTLLIDIHRYLLFIDDGWIVLLVLPCAMSNACHVALLRYKPALHKGSFLAPVYRRPLPAPAVGKYTGTNLSGLASAGPLFILAHRQTLLRGDV
jgi:hypothetical protein